MNASWDGRVSHTILGPSVTLTCPGFKNNHVLSISLVLFDTGIPSWCMDASWNGRVSCIIYRVTVTLNLTSDLVFRISASGAYLLYYLR